ncbi:MAG TPA: OB-fold domain-containing protein [Acidimicrobiales bacterium]|nr:OB-fold domain-containing protein [Acidimicrobiales bacterium]
MRGILGAAGYVPYRRLDRSEVTRFLGTGGGKGTRAVASHDEDATTMGVEAARLALRSVPAAAPGALWFATATPPYLDKTNAAALHAALRLPGEVPAFDFGGALRSGVGALLAALGSGPGGAPTLVVMADQRDGLPGGPDESAGGDAAAALLVGDDGAGTPVVAEFLGAASATDEFVDRWRAPGEQRSKSWEERFGETRYVPLGRDAYGRALKAAGVGPEDVARLAVTSMHGRAAKVLAKELAASAAGPGALDDDLTDTVGQAGAAQPGLVLTAMLEAAGPGEVVVLVHLADGADALVLRVTDAAAGRRVPSPVADQVAAGAPLPYGKFLAWRGQLTPEPPRRPEPQRVSTPAAWRAEDWKYGFVGSRDRSSGAVHLPPARVSMRGGAVDDMEPIARADAVGTIVTFTVDRLAYSPSPPIVFAVVDFEGGGRFPVELTDVDPDALAIGDKVEMTFRRLFVADGIHDYFWKARPVRSASGASGSKA